MLRFGAYGPEVIDRLRWMAEVLGPGPRRRHPGVRADRRHDADRPGARHGRRGPQPLGGRLGAARPQARARDRPPRGRRRGADVPGGQRPLRAQPLDGRRQALHGRRRARAGFVAGHGDVPQRRRVRDPGRGHRRPVVHRPGRPGRRPVLPGLRTRRRQPRHGRLGDHRDARHRRLRHGGLTVDHDLRRRHTGRRAGREPRDAPDHARAAPRLPVAAAATSSAARPASTCSRCSTPASCR